MKSLTKALFSTLLVLSALLINTACGGGGGSDDSSAAAADNNADAFGDWARNMKTYGRQHCEEIKHLRASSDPALAATYYDAIWIYYQIADYTRDPYFRDCAQRAKAVYRDGYVFKNKGKVPGYWNFTHGLTTDYLKTKDERSKEAVILLSQTAAFASDATNPSELRPAELSRETAYAIMSYLNAEKLGQPRRRRLAALVENALGHLDQWFISRTAPYVRPFMVGLTAQALISYYDKNPDPRILSSLMIAADSMWNDTWLPGRSSFMYTDRSTDSGGEEPAPDLNLLIVPLYGWLYSKTGQQRFIERGDAIFAGGVRQAFIESAKQFNQNYRWSFAYIKWRAKSAVLR